MTLNPGTRLGAYEILSALGAGGMGEVYRARDTKLDRDVAIKILPEAFALDADRVARFQREAKVLASLNHPNIAIIHGLEQAGDVHALVMELVPGEDLSQRIARGVIPVDEALPIARQIAEALEAAHELGIIHRDLKPANIKVRPDGTVKVLDFGLAKALEAGGAGGAGRESPSMSPTITTPAMTQAGMILGTAAYMSPEQARGKVADKRSDVWAFGAVLYEMLSGERAFKGDELADTLAAVLRQDIDPRALPPSTPASVRRLIERCLERDVRQRLRDIGEARIVLADPGSPARADTADGVVSAPQRPLWRRAMVVVALALALVGAAVPTALLWRRQPSPPSQVARFAFALPPGKTLTVARRAVAMSPDGSRIAFSAEGGLFLRSVADFDAREIRGANPGITPTFSPDGQSLIFYADSAIKRISIDGGKAVTICEVGIAPSSMTWTNNDILFSAGGAAIMRVSADGGKPEVILDLKNSEDLAYGPQLLPDGETLLLSIVRRTSASIGRWDEAEIVAQSLKTGVRKRLIEGGSDGQYVPTGHIVYVSDTTLFAVPFDLSTLAVTGGAVPVVDGVNLGATSGTGRTAHFAFSKSGSLVYVPGPLSEGQNLLFFDDKGGAESVGLPFGRYQFPRVSPDGKRIAFETSDGKQVNVSIYELSGASSARRLTFGGNNRFPIWSADGTHVAFQSDRDGDLAIFWQPADGGKEERLTKPDAGTQHVPESWSPHGDVLLFSATKDFASSLWTLSLRDRSAIPFSDAKDSTLPTDAVFSPDGRWVAYQMGTSAAVEATTYAQPFPPTGTKYQIVPGGRPMWSRDGKKLFFIPDPGRLMAVTVTTTASTIAVTNPVSVPRGFGGANPQIARTFDIMPDGRILGVGIPGRSDIGYMRTEIQVVLNWFEELKARVPPKK